MLKPYTIGNRLEYVKPTQYYLKHSYRTLPGMLMHGFETQQSH
jgi:hypothetical protein